MNAQKAVSIAMIGTQHAHAAGKWKTLRQTARVDLVGIFEPDADARRKAARSGRFEGARWLSEGETLEERKIEAVFVETSPWENVRWARRAVAAGKHVHLDKAPSPSLEDFRSLLREARDARLIVQMGYMFRHNPAAVFARDAVQQGMLGDVFLINAQIPTALSGRYTESRTTVGSHPGAIFYELACHFLDLALLFLGKPDKVTSVMRSDFPVSPLDRWIDNAVAVFECPGAMAVIQTWAMGSDPMVHRRFDIHGTRGTILIEPFEPCRVRLHLSEAAGGRQAGWQEVDLPWRERYVADVEELLACIRGERSFPYPPEHDLAVHEALLKACGVH